MPTPRFPGVASPAGVHPVAALLAAAALTLSGPSWAQGASSCAVVPEAKVDVADAGALADAISAAKCGRALILAAGHYDQDAEITKNCPASAPLLITARDPQSAILAGKLKLAGDHLVVSGLKIDGGQIELMGQDNRVTRNLFVSGGGLVIRSASGRIDHNEFRPAGGNGIDVALKLSRGDRRPAAGNLIDYNLFHSTNAPAPRAAKQDDDDEDDGHRPSVALYLGQFSARQGRADMLAYGNVGTVVEHNLFLDVARRRSVHIKSNGNEIRANTFIASPGIRRAGQITVRSGQNNEIAGNYISGQIRMLLFEEDNRAIGNVLVDGAQLVVMAGGGEMTQYDGPQQRPAVHSLVAGNQGILRIGEVVARRQNKAPAEGTVVEGHQGPIEKDLEANTTIRDKTSISLPKVQALTTAEVGLAAPDPRCPGA